MIAEEREEARGEREEGRGEREWKELGPKIYIHNKDREVIQNFPMVESSPSLPWTLARAGLPLPSPPFLVSP